MADLEFYRDTYLGSQIPDNAFPELAARASEFLQGFKSAYRVKGSALEEDMALCAMAEELWHRQKQSVSSASVGNVSVRYFTDGRTDLRRAMLNKAQIYLKVYRGVAQ